MIYSIRAGIIVIDAQTHTIIDVNPAALEMMGTTKDAVVNQRCTNVICLAEVGKCPITDLNQMVDNAERILLRSDGRKIPIIKSVVPVMLHGTPCLLETFIDNSYRKEIELRLAESEEKYRALTENTPDILFSTDMAGIITYASPQVNKYGFLVDEVIRKSLRILIHPADAAMVESNLSRELEKGPSSYPSSGSWISGELSTGSRRRARSALMCPVNPLGYTEYCVMSRSGNARKMRLILPTRN